MVDDDAGNEDLALSLRVRSIQSENDECLIVVTPCLVWRVEAFGLHQEKKLILHDKNWFLGAAITKENIALFALHYGVGGTPGADGDTREARLLHCSVEERV